MFLFTLRGPKIPKKLFVKIMVSIVEQIYLEKTFEIFKITRKKSWNEFSPKHYIASIVFHKSFLKKLN